MCGKSGGRISLRPAASQSSPAIMIPQLILFLFGCISLGAGKPHYAVLPYTSSFIADPRLAAPLVTGAYITPPVASSSSSQVDIRHDYYLPGRYVTYLSPVLVPGQPQQVLVPGQPQPVLVPGHPQPQPQPQPASPAVPALEPAAEPVDIGPKETSPARLEGQQNTAASAPQPSASSADQTATPRPVSPAPVPFPYSYYG